MNLISILHLNATQIIAVYFAFWMISTALNALPEPNDKSGLWYRWFYGFSHGLLASWKNVVLSMKAGKDEGLGNVAGPTLK